MPEDIIDLVSGRLLPYLSANVQFELSRRSDVLLVPAAALQWKPSREQIASQFRETLTVNSTGNHSDAAQQGILWIPDGNQVRPLPVRLGLTDGLVEDIDDPRSPAHIRYQMVELLRERPDRELRSADAVEAPAFALVLFRRFGRTGLYALIVLDIIICNIQVVKVVELFGLVTTLGNILYASIFFATDVLGEVYGKRAAREGVWLGFTSLLGATL